MIAENHVSFETAKLLKEKGFDEECSSWYSTKGNQYYDIDSYEADLDGITKLCSCPTHQMAMAWLREKGVHIEIHYNRYGENYKYKLIYKPELLDDVNSLGYYFSYEEAVEAALKYALENLI